MSNYKGTHGALFRPLGVAVRLSVRLVGKQMEAEMHIEWQVSNGQVMMAAEIVLCRGAGSSIQVEEKGPSYMGHAGCNTFETFRFYCGLRTFCVLFLVIF